MRELEIGSPFTRLDDWTPYFQLTHLYVTELRDKEAVESGFNL